MKKNIENRSLRFCDKENEITLSFEKMHDLIGTLDHKMKDVLSDKEKSFLISFDKVVSLIAKDMKSLKDTYTEAAHNFEINPNLVKLNKEINFLKSQLDEKNDENALLKKIMINYKKNACNIQDDRKFEKSFVIETQRENKYLKLTLDDLIKNQTNNEKKDKKLSSSFIFKDNQTFELNICDLIKNEELDLDEKINEFQKNFQIFQKQNVSQILSYQKEISILKSKLISLTKTNNQLFLKINCVSKIEKLFSESIEIIKEKIFFQKEKSSKNSFIGQSNLQTTINNSNTTQISDIIHGIDFENFGKMDKIELITSFLLHPKFLNFVKAMATQKKCCHHFDCFFNINKNEPANETKNNNNSNDQKANDDLNEIRKTPHFFSEFYEKRRKMFRKENKTVELINFTERTRSQEKNNNYLVLTNREDKKNDENHIINNNLKETEVQFTKNAKSKSQWNNKNLVTQSIDATKCDQKFNLFFRKRLLRKKGDSKDERSQSISTNQILQN